MLNVGDITTVNLSGIREFYAPAIVIQYISEKYVLAMGIVPGQYLGYKWIIDRDGSLA